MPTVGVIGAGTMGAGIAQVAAASGWTVHLADVDAAIVDKALAGVTRRFDRLVEKGRMTPEQRTAAAGRLNASTSAGGFGDCELVIEAVIEDMEAKCAVLADVVRHAGPRTAIATNTSSLSVSEIGQRVGAAERVVGMHFFNPVPLMPLVEVIAGRRSDDEVVRRVADIAREWGKTPAQANDTPGFIVNRVARGYYLEPMRMLGEGVAGIDEIDQILRKLGGFRMGPFALMDLVGIDVNYTVSCRVWEQLGKPPRLEPHALQRELFERGHLGRKTKRGWYSYQYEHPIPAAPVERKSFDVPEPVYQAVRLFCDPAAEESGSITEQYVLARTLVAIINEAALALGENVAEPEAIDTAMRLGTNYPHGPLEWAEKIGRRTCRFLLDTLERHGGEGRFVAADWLKQ